MTNLFNTNNDACCGGSQNPGEDGPLCCNFKPDPFTEEELDIFDQLRMLKDEVKQLQARLEVIALKQNGQPLTPHQLDEKQTLIERISALRREWDRLKKKGEEASIRRMIQLGHIDPE